MKRLVCWVLVSLYTLPLWAERSWDPLFNKVVLQLSAEQWVTTKTALVTVGINASVSDNAVEHIQGDVLNKLRQLSDKGDWHIVSLNRTQDQSGLEQIQISSQARLPGESVSGLRAKAKAISKPGETFTIDNIEFTPSMLEIRAANTVLRRDIYEQANMEVASLNKLYPDQQYYIHQINFVGMMMPMARQENMMYAKAASPAPSPALDVGDKLSITATVELASSLSEDVLKTVKN